MPRRPATGRPRRLVLRALEPTPQPKLPRRPATAQTDAPPVDRLSVCGGGLRRSRGPLLAALVDDLGLDDVIVARRVATRRGRALVGLAALVDDLCELL